MSKDLKLEDIEGASLGDMIHHDMCILISYFILHTIIHYII